MYEIPVFSVDGSRIYVGNFLDSDLSVLSVQDDTVTDTGKNCGAQLELSLKTEKIQLCSRRT
jgi:hypothetical protein